METERDARGSETEGRRRGLVPIDRRQFGKVAAAFGFHAAVGAWYTTLRDGEVPTVGRVVEKALGISTAEAAKPPKHKLRLGTSVTKKVEEVSKYGLWEFAEDISKRTDGEVQIEIVGGSTLCGEVNCHQKLVGRVIDIGFGSSQNAAPTFPYNNVLDYAYLWPGRAAMFHFLYHPASDKLFRKVVRQKYGVEWLWSHAETRNVLLGLKYRNAPALKRPDDIRGAKLRITGSQMGRIALSVFGANPVPVAWEETLEGLKSGLIDGQETWSSAAASFNMGPVLSQEIWIEFFAGLGHAYMRRDILDRMSPSVREAMLESGYQMQQWTQRHNEQALATIVGITDPPPPGSLWAKHGIKVSRLTPAEKKVWEQMASPQSNPKPWEEWRDKLTKIAGFDAYPELYKLAREIPADTPPAEVKPRRWWKDA
jgi:TRAP-type C4-dicarboxylate transport system substrate-binding protein